MKSIGTIIRLTVVLGIIVISAIAVKYKINIIEKKNNAVIISNMLEWQKHGKPVDVEIVEKGSLPFYLKLSSKPISATLIESYVSKNTGKLLRRGQAAKALIGDKEIKGTVYTSGQFNINYGLYRTTIKLNTPLPKDSRKSIIPVNVRYKTLKNAISISSDSIIKEGNQSYVFKLTDKDTVEKIPVLPHMANDIRTVLKKGLSKGDRVVFRGMNVLQPGDKVRIHNCSNYNCN